MRERFAGRLRAIRDRVLWAQNTTASFTVDSKVRKAQLLPQGRERNEALQEIVAHINKISPSFPGISYNLESQLGVCYQGLGQPREALEHFGAALDLHPAQGLTSDFPAYVLLYLKTVDEIIRLPKGEKEPPLQDAIKRMGSLFSKVPPLAYMLHGFLGVSCQEVGQKGEALVHNEQAVLLHPTPTPDSDFPKYATNYISIVRLLTQDAIRHLNHRNKQPYVEQLVRVMNSTGKVLMRYPTIEGLLHENHTAFGWLEKTLGPKQFRRVIEINPN